MGFIHTWCVGADEDRCPVTGWVFPCLAIKPIINTASQITVGLTLDLPFLGYTSAIQFSFSPFFLLLFLFLFPFSPPPISFILSELSSPNL